MMETENIINSSMKAISSWEKVILRALTLLRYILELECLNSNEIN